MMMKEIKLLVFLLTVLMLSSMVFGDNSSNQITQNSINASNGTNTTGGGFIVNSYLNNRGVAVNGTSLSSSSLVGDSLSVVNLSGWININMSLIANKTHGSYVNFTFSWILGSNQSTMYNRTLFNSTINQTNWNLSFDTSTITQGIYNISIGFENSSPEATNFATGIYDFVRGYFIAVDNVAPPVLMWSNITNGTNFSATTSIVQINLTANDSTTYGIILKVGVRNDSKEMNLTPSRNTTSWVAQVLINETFGLTDGVYTVYAYGNDSVGNLNITVANVSFRLDRLAPNITNFSLGPMQYFPTNNITNWSDSTPDFRFNFSDLSPSANCSLFVNGTLRATSSAAVNGTAANLTSSAISTQGHHYAYVTCKDGSGNVGNSSGSDRGSNVTGILFSLDTVSPDVSAIVVANVTNGVNLSADLSAVTANLLWNISAVINDTTLTVQSVIFNVTNGSGLVTVGTQTYNFSSIKNASLYVAVGTFDNGTNLGNSVAGYRNQSINISALAEGRYNITIVTNDTVGNVNATQSFAFAIDRTKPSVSVSCTNSPAVGATVTCTCTTSDALTGLESGAGFSGGVSSESTTASSVGSYTSGICSAIDYAGNRQTATGSWTVVAASSSGSGGGGGGSSGGVSKGVENQFEKKVWTSINKGETATVSVKDGHIGVTGVEFTTAAATYGVTLQVEKVSTLPTSVKALDTKVYKYVKITESNVAKALDGMAKVNFKVTVEWLKEQGLTKDNVALYRSVDNTWVALKTTVGENDGTYQHYVAETPGFSYFAIGQGTAGVAASTVAKEKSAEQPVMQDKTQAPDTAAGEVTSTPSAETADLLEEGAQTTSDSSAWWVWIVFVLAIGVVIVVVYWWVKK